MACPASRIDSSGVAGNLILASAIRNEFTRLTDGSAAGFELVTAGGFVLGLL